MKALVVPEGCAYGFQSIDDDIEMVYFSTKAYCKEAEGTIRYDDPKVNIKLPGIVVNMSKKDILSSFITGDFKGIESII
jgi:dTDP-4-dehydrorhamnose 3,5-epimerase